MHTINWKCEDVKMWKYIIADSWDNFWNWLIIFPSKKNIVQGNISVVMKYNIIYEIKNYL